MKVFMEPGLSVVQGSEGGINTIVRNYVKWSTGQIEYVDNIEEADVHAVHAGGMTQFRPNIPIVNHLHGLYWTGDYTAHPDEYRMNFSVINVMRGATVMTVPSEWVAQPIRRDMRVNPAILPHGYDPNVWKRCDEKQEYIYWNKNRDSDVCTPKWLNQLAALTPKMNFVSTFGTPQKNAHIVGVQNYQSNFDYVQQAKIYLSTTKETFGIAVLEALASGTPVLGFAEGGNLDLVRHKVDGYLAKPGDIDDLKAGLHWISDNYDQVQATTGQQVSDYTWDKIIPKLLTVYQQAIEQFVPPASRKVSFVVPLYNSERTVLDTLRSIEGQTQPPHEVVVVDNNSTDDGVLKILQSVWTIPVRIVKESRQGVAHARNTGIAEAEGEYIVCIDADDKVDPKYVETVRVELDRNPTTGVAYSGLTVMSPEGNLQSLSPFPPHYNFETFLTGLNQVPTCAMFHKRLWERVGGFRQKYAPLGAGAEDAEFWFRMGLYGYFGKKVTNQGLFWYRQGGTTSVKDYLEPDWRGIHAWQKNRDMLPFAATTRPETISNPVRQQDTLVSVIIPCTSAHIDVVWDALDSVDYQTWRHKVETVVIFNGVTPEFLSNTEYARLEKAFPHVKFYAYMQKGAGFARNRGAEYATGKLLLFLDADDFLEPRAVEQMVQKYMQTGSIVYGNYYGWATIDKAEEQRLLSQDRIAHMHKNRLAKIKFFAANYDQQRAEAQPQLMSNGQFYIWSLISALIPKAYWQCIGGFDETMESWEDWDFWIRLAREKITFVKLDQFVLNYRFNTGSLRELGKSVHQKLLAQMEAKRETMAGCCGSKTKKSLVNSPKRTPLLTPAATPTMQTRSLNRRSTELILVRLTDTRQEPQLVSVEGTRYGMRSNGEEFYMQESHAARYPHKYVPVGDVPTVTDGEVDIPDPEPSEPKTEGLVTKEPVIEKDEENAGYTKELLDLGITFSPRQKKLLKDAGIITVGDLLRQKETFDELDSFSDEKRKELIDTVARISGITL